MSMVNEALPDSLPRWEIPSDWQWVSIADVGRVITGNTPPTKDESNYGNHIPFVKPPALVDGGIRSTPEGLSESGAQLSRTLPAGAVLVSCIGGLGKTGIAKVPVAFNQQINAVVFDERVVPEYGFYYVQTLKPWLYGVASATTLPIVNKGKFQRAPFPLAPLDQQKRIVAEIEKQFSRLDEAVANLKRVKANLKRYKAAVLKAAVEGRLVETEAELVRREGRSYETGEQLLQCILETRRSQWKGKGKYKEPAAPDTADLPELPEGWVWATVEQLGDVGTGATPLRSKREYYDGGKVPWVTSGALNEEFVSAADEYITDLAVQETNAKLFPAHTLLVAMYGEGKTRGKVSELLIKAATNQACAAIVMEGFSEKVRDYVKLVFLKNYEDIRRLSSGGVQPNLNLSHIKATAIPLAPLAEQNRIVAEVDRRFSLVRELEAQVEANLRRAERFRLSILGAAFSGHMQARPKTPSYAVV